MNAAVSRNTEAVVDDTPLYNMLQIRWTTTLDHLMGMKYFTE